jgi:two-component system cell cycle response regulator DivK
MFRVLVADDDPVSRGLIRDALEPRGYEVIEANDGQDALEKAWNLIPHIVLLDIQMPVLDGFQVLERLREDPRCATLPIVALTAYAMRGDREKALALGFDDYITKPITPKALRSRIEVLLPGGEH